MTTSEHRLVLPATLAAPARARRAVADVLDAAGAPRAWRADCALLVSEVVTNAVLHGGGTISLRCDVRADRVRVEVGDGSPLGPMVRDPSQGATTGRGMRLVDALASSWGVAFATEGKVVWFELGALDGRPARPAAPPDERELRVVVLCDAPVALLRTAIEWADTTTRELAYLALSGQLPDTFPDGWEPPALSTTTLASALQAAPPAEPTAEVRFSVPADARDAALERLRIVEVTQRLYDEGTLLLAPMASEEVRRCRVWVLSEIAAQLDGAAPTPWGDA